MDFLLIGPGEMPCVARAQRRLETAGPTAWIESLDTPIQAARSDVLGVVFAGPEDAGFSLWVASLRRGHRWQGLALHLCGGPIGPLATAAHEARVSCVPVLDLDENLATFVRQAMHPRQLIQRSVARFGRANGLSMREREVLELVAAGVPRSDLRRWMSCSEGTVKTYVHRLLQKSSMSSLSLGTVISRILEDARPEPYLQAAG